ncbi:hypothetical protein M3201_04630 [Paenibacillus motobuensis]|uniref:hypothetical protein n=1 Tax=Paenibacillus TaxID=44249 RepID=UPI0020419009|nr:MULTISPECIES: hypothetical protein [Paenibacillus]MCM3038984.1 hypothetical protein [Paenibacillus lutimineralis]MCM3646088.1 hypothetical protein [Paenibacillus motobuensis]
MGYEFVIEPLSYINFEDETAQLEQCREWGLVSGKATKTKAFYYKGYGQNLPCNIVGMVDKITAVIELENKQLHCIHPSYLKEMQAASYGQKPVADEAGAADPENAVLETDEALTSPELENNEVRVEEETTESSEAVMTAAAAQNTEGITAESADKSPEAVEQPIVDISDPDYAPKEKVRKAKKSKIELPEGKVKMMATVQDFTTVPNHFADRDDEVIIYEAVAILDPETEIGEAWSSHSATLKKLELAIGDKISFEAKIVAKKLTKHPVAYKINNPAKIQKENS